LKEGEIFRFPPPSLPETRNDLSGHGIRTKSGYEAEEGDAGVPEFDGLRARLFHVYRVVWTRFDLLLYLSTQFNQ
jgi:hypothetical protein